MEIYILRHGIAVEPGSPGFEDDSQRPLTAEGKKKMRRIAKAIKAMDLSFDLVLTSPFLRAKQTADIVVEFLKAKKKLVLAEELTPSGSPRALIARIRNSIPPQGKVLLVGHEPYLSRFVSLLVTGDFSAAITLKKGGLCKLTAESLKQGRCASLDWLLTPAQMQLMAG